MIKILIVDDEKTICDLIDINLSAAGYHCKAVQDGLVALDLIKKEHFLKKLFCNPFIHHRFLLLQYHHLLRQSDWILHSLKHLQDEK